MLAKHTTPDASPVTPAVARLGWATMETRDRPTAHEHKHQTGPQRPVRAPYSASPPPSITSSFRPPRSLLLSFCDLITTRPQPLSQPIYYRLPLHPPMGGQTRLHCTGPDYLPEQRGLLIPTQPGASATRFRFASFGRPPSVLRVIIRPFTEPASSSEPVLYYSHRP